MNTLVLKKVAKILNKLGCIWGVGGSTLLNQYNLVKTPKDIDILIDSKDEEIIKSEMNKIGKIINIKNKDEFKSDTFFRYEVEGVIVEFIGGFKIVCEDKVYEVLFDEKSIVSSVFKDNIKINLMSLEDWFVIYDVMNDPKDRIPLILDYFKENKVKHKFILVRNLSLKIPDRIKNNIELLLSTY